MRSRFWKYTFGNSQIEVICVNLEFVLLKICWLSQFLLKGCACDWTNMQQQPSTSNAYLFHPIHTLWAKIGWVSIFLKKQIPNWRKWPQFESCQMYIFKIYSSSTIHQATPFNLKCIFVHSHAHPLSKNWLSQHIFKKTDSKLSQMTSIWELPNVYVQNLLVINNTPDNNLQPQINICPLPCTPSEQKLAKSAYF